MTWPTTAAGPDANSIATTNCLPIVPRKQVKAGSVTVVPVNFFNFVRLTCLMLSNINRRCDAVSTSLGRLKPEANAMCGH